jgi:hypothetical protein
MVRTVFPDPGTHPMPENYDHQVPSSASLPGAATIFNIPAVWLWTGYRNVIKWRGGGWLVECGAELTG